MFIDYLSTGKGIYGLSKPVACQVNGQRGKKITTKSTKSTKRIRSSQSPEENLPAKRQA
jgi:hypothetical protein